MIQNNVNQHMNNFYYIVSKIRIKNKMKLHKNNNNNNNMIMNFQKVWKIKK